MARLWFAAHGLVLHWLDTIVKKSGIVLSFIIIGCLTVLVSLFTLFSGFGLGTLLLPVFLLFFSPSLAITATAIVHLANNLLKVFIFARYANRQVLLLFSIPAILAAFAGAFLIQKLNGLPALGRYHWQGHWFDITPIRLTIGMLMTLFACLDFSPGFKALTLPKQWIPLGGLLSGFFGGLTGQQGAFRAACLVRAGLEKEAFIGTTVLAATLVDIVRLGVYGATLIQEHQAVLFTQTNWNLLLWAIICAFIGTYLGSRFLKKVTLAWMKKIIAILLIAYGLLLGCGVI